MPRTCSSLRSISARLQGWSTRLQAPVGVVADRALLQVGAFGDPGRDPRGWTVSVAYAAVVPSTDASTKAGVPSLCSALMLLCTLAQLVSDVWGQHRAPLIL